MKHLLLVTLISIFSISTMASIASEGPKENTFKAGVLFGNVALGNDNSAAPAISKNSIGFGGLFGYSLEDELSFEFAYMKSSHDDLDHSDLSLGVEYYFNSYEPFYYGLTGGVSFTKNEISGTVSGDDTAFGLFVGIGADVFTKRGMVVGLQARYYDMFSSDKNIGGTKYNLVDNYYTILARVLFQF
jgi:hypothetical protein